MSDAPHDSPAPMTPAQPGDERTSTDALITGRTQRTLFDDELSSAAVQKLAMLEDQTLAWMEEVTSVFDGQLQNATGLLRNEVDSLEYRLAEYVDSVTQKLLRVIGSELEVQTVAIVDMQKKASHEVVELRRDTRELQTRLNAVPRAEGVAYPESNAAVELWAAADRGLGRLAAVEASVALVRDDVNTWHMERERQCEAAVNGLAELQREIQPLRYELAEASRAQAEQSAAELRQGLQDMTELVEKSQHGLRSRVRQDLNALRHDVASQHTKLEEHAIRIAATEVAVAAAVTCAGATSEEPDLAASSVTASPPAPSGNTSPVEIQLQKMPPLEPAILRFESKATQVLAATCEDPDRAAGAGRVGKRSASPNKTTGSAVVNAPPASPALARSESARGSFAATSGGRVRRSASIACQPQPAHRGPPQVTVVAPPVVAPPSSRYPSTPQPPLIAPYTPPVALPMASQRCVSPAHASVVAPTRTAVAPAAEAKTPAVPVVSTPVGVGTPVMLNRGAITEIRRMPSGRSPPPPLQPRR
eukprot:NODE_5340_length_1781_cov_6.674728.p1 GENE.NODE_5340_length_1781_cov_6.674728~~NODE_5340_length_1781_cov_6.674728.p1  ORF type:complete len:533 (+),score=117.27 NODE_5340_length_1781_cov_6.674728:91-1689(+)